MYPRTSHFSGQNLDLNILLYVWVLYKYIWQKLDFVVPYVASVRRYGTSVRLILNTRYVTIPYTVSVFQHRSSDASFEYDSPGYFADTMFFYNVTRRFHFVFSRFMKLVEAGLIFLLRLQLKSRSGRFRSGKRRLFFLGGKKAAGKGGGESIRKRGRWRGTVSNFTTATAKTIGLWRWGANAERQRAHTHTFTRTRTHTGAASNNIS